MKKIISLLVIGLMITTTQVWAAPNSRHGGMTHSTMTRPHVVNHAVSHNRPIQHHNVAHHRPIYHHSHYRPLPPPRPIFGYNYYRPYYPRYYSSYYYQPINYTYTNVVPVYSEPASVVVTEPVVVNDPYASINTTANIINTAANVATTVKYLSR